MPVILVPQASLRKELGLSATERYFSFANLVEDQRITELEKQIASKRGRSEELNPLEKDAEIILNRMQTLHDVISGAAFAIVPNPGKPNDRWVQPPQTADFFGMESAEKLRGLLKQTADAYRARDADGFRQVTGELRRLLVGLAPANYPSVAEIDREVHYNHLHPFRWAWILYAAGFFLLLAGRTQRLGGWIFAGGLAFHAYGILLRCLIAGRPPVTNMYESVIWVGFGVAAFAMIFSLVLRARIYLTAAAPLSVLALILADSLPSVLNPSIAPLPPVLRDNFWLMVHVLTITLGYAAFAVAMGFSHCILGRYLFRPSMIGEKSDLHRLLYRVLQVGVLLLAAGTILGGVWANYSWGRFWGWDPKETWALIALLTYIFAIHGKMIGWWGNFGLAVAGAVCFNAVLMAWYGVNFVLGKGLHSYGFGGGGAAWVGSIVVLDLLFVGLCIRARLKQPREESEALDSRTTEGKEPAALKI